MAHWKHTMLTQFSASEHRGGTQEVLSSKSNKRARIVCSRCHEKKVKCDLWKSTQGLDESQCSNCLDAGVQCRCVDPPQMSKQCNPEGTADQIKDLSPRHPAIPQFANSKRLRLSKRGLGRLQNLGRVESEKAEALPVGNAAINVPVDGNVPSADFGDLPPFLSPIYPAAENNRVEAEIDERGILGNTNSPQVGLEQQTSLSVDSQRQNQSYFGDSCYLRLFNECDSCVRQEPPQIRGIDNIPPNLQETHIEVFFEHSKTWCPILDREILMNEPDFRHSVLLRHALALCGNQINPSLLDHSPSMDHYVRAKELFYGNHEPNPLIQIISIMLFYWWSVESPHVVSLDTTWWWTGTAIRLAQQIGLHRQPMAGETPFPGESPGLRRRIWWTLVARERLTSLSQGRPCLVDLDDCDVPMPTSNDFPQPHELRNTVFIKWVSLCELIGRIGKMLRRRQEATISATQIARELMTWVQSLPLSLQPSIKGIRTTDYDRDVHGLHLAYLSCITLLHFHKDAQPLPQASIAAIVAASCTARIFHDYLIRGSLSFLAGQAGWNITLAILALLHARRLDGFTVDADADIHILRSALKVLSKKWHSARMFQIGIDKLMGRELQSRDHSPRPAASGTAFSSSMDELAAVSGINWHDYFPYIGEDTSPLIGKIIRQDDLSTRFPEIGWTLDFSGQLNQFLARPEDFDLDILQF